MTTATPGDHHRSSQLVQIDGKLWYIALHWGEVRGRAEVVGVEVWSRPPMTQDPGRLPLVFERMDPGGEPVTTSVLRALNLGSLIIKDRQEAIESNEFIATQPGFRPEAQRSAGEMAAKLSGRPAKYDRRHYEEVARVYGGAYGRGHSPTRAVAQHFGVSQAQAGKWVSTARNKYGLLGETSKGRASGASRRDEGGHAASDESAASDR